MEHTTLHIWIKWIHLVATAAWIGGMLTNLLIYLPVIRKQLDPGTTGKLMKVVMSRFKWLVYGCMGIFVLTGVLLVSLWASVTGPIRAGDSWFILFFAKMLLFLILVVMSVVAFEVLAPAVAREVATGPSVRLERLQRRQGIMAFFALALGLLIVLLSASL